MEVDLAVIGAGSAGLGAARAARRKGASVALVERRRLGGDCTWTGCVPSKALIARAAAIHHGRRVGLTGEVDVPALLDQVRRSREVIGADEDHPTLAAEGITVLDGSASFTDPRRLDVDGTAVHARRAVIVATGARPLLPPIDGLDAVDALTSDTLFELTDAPRSMVVLGGGAIGIEQAQAWARLGTQVTVVTRGRILGKEEPETSEVIARVLTEEGVRVVVGASASRVERFAGGVVVVLADGERLEAERLLVATGRTPTTAGLGLERIGADIDDRGFVVTDEKLRTTVDGVWAAGDVTGRLQFTHADDEQGRLAVNNAFARLSQSFSTEAIPWTTFTDPEVGRVGMTEAQAFEAHGSHARVAFLPLTESDRGRATGHTAGFVKLIGGPRGALGSLGGGVLLGATVVCPGGGDVVQECAVIMRTGAFLGRLAQTVHAYPTWGMTVREAAAQFFFTSRGRDARPARGGLP